MKVNDLRTPVDVVPFKDIKRGEGFALRSIPSKVLIKVVDGAPCSTPDGAHITAISTTGEWVNVAFEDSCIALELKMQVKNRDQFVN